MTAPRHARRWGFALAFVACHGGDGGPSADITHTTDDVTATPSPGPRTADYRFEGEDYLDRVGDSVFALDASGDGILDVDVTFSALSRRGLLETLAGPWTAAGPTQVLSRFPCLATQPVGVSQVVAELSTLSPGPELLVSQTNGAEALLIMPPSALDLCGYNVASIDQIPATAIWTVVDCAGWGGIDTALCLITTNGDIQDYSGHLKVLPGPFDALHTSVAQATVTVHGPKNAEYGYTEATVFDADGDGAPEHVAGAIRDLAYDGRIFLVGGLPDGDYQVEDVALATVTGEAGSGGEAGGALDHADLDGDGYEDLLVGASYVDQQGRVYAVKGPFAGDRDLAAEPAIDADAPEAFRFGWSVRAGDIDADGAPDVAIGVPGGPNDPRPGYVALFSGPWEGRRSETADAWARFAGSDTPDSFGKEMAVADLDGDGYADLAVGAPDWPGIYGSMGYLAVYYGAGLTAP